MRVMLLIDALGNGGAERQLTLLAEHLPEEWQPHVVSLGGGLFAARLRGRGVPLTILQRRSRLDPLPAMDLWRSMRDSPPDVVHSWGWMSTMISGPLCRMMGTPLIDGAIRSGVREADHPSLRRFSKALATKVVANSQAGLEAWGVGPERGTIVYNGFDWSRMPAELTTRGGHSLPLAHDRDSFTVVMAARMAPQKDFRTVIRAAHLLRGQWPRWRFVLVGHGEDRARLMAEAADLIAEGTVEFPDPGLEVLGQVVNADVGVLMTNTALHQEGCSNTIMEYMACNLPVVCSEGGGNREVVVDGTTGFVIPPFDAEGLALKLLWLREHESEGRAMGEAGRLRIVDLFSTTRMVADYVRVYEAVARASRHRHLQ